TPRSATAPTTPTASASSAACPAAASTSSTSTAPASTPTGSGCTPEGRTAMSALREAEKLLSAMTRAEKAQLLQWVVRDLADCVPGIESTPGVCGGDPCIAGTRIPVWALEQYRRLGMNEAGLLDAFPSLRAEDLANAWAFVRAHTEEIDRQIRENEEA